MINEELKEKGENRSASYVANYYLDINEMANEVKVWAQMFFDDGSVTQGKYVPRSIFDEHECIETLAKQFLEDTSRKEGVLFVWGAGRVYARKAQLLLPTRGPFKGSETLRLIRL